jgi:dihydrofolate reductase/thymidylate synthase
MPYSFIACVDSKLGIGKIVDNEYCMPWHNIPADLQYFKNMTIHKTIVMGYNTFTTLNFKPLKNRLNIVFTTKQIYSKFENLIFVNSFEMFEKKIKNMNKNDIYVIGGGDLFHQFLRKYDIDNIYLTQLSKDYKCDFFLPHIPNTFKLVHYSTKNDTFTESNGKEITFRFLKYKNVFMKSEEYQYLDMLQTIINDGQVMQNRTGIDTLTIYGTKMEFDISHTVPLLTTKRIAWKSCIEELLWFLRGETDVSILQEKGVKIWNGNSSREFLDSRNLQHYRTGLIGKSYGFQFRFFGGDYNEWATLSNPLRYKEHIKGFDQIEYVLDKLKNDPSSRKIVISLWNPNDLAEMALEPCLYTCTFNVDNYNGLVCNVFQRSKDAFLGEPWNIFSYTVLTYILAKQCGLVPKKLILHGANHHVYSNHISQCLLQCNRQPTPFPCLQLSECISTKGIQDITIEDFELIGYFPHNSIKGKMAV